MTIKAAKLNMLLIKEHIAACCNFSGTVESFIYSGISPCSNILLQYIFLIFVLYESPPRGYRCRY